MLTPVNIQKIELSIAFTAVYLCSDDRTFVIYLSPQSGKLLQQLISKTPNERPIGFDVITSLITGNDLTPHHILIEEEKEGVFFTKIFLEKLSTQPVEILEIDARPSESLAIAIKYQIPIYIFSELLQRLQNLSNVS